MSWNRPLILIPPITASVVLVGATKLILSYRGNEPKKRNNVQVSIHQLNPSFWFHETYSKKKCSTPTTVPVSSVICVTQQSLKIRQDIWTLIFLCIRHSQVKTVTIVTISRKNKKLVKSMALKLAIPSSKISTTTFQGVVFKPQYLEVCNMGVDKQTIYIQSFQYPKLQPTEMSGWMFLHFLPEFCSFSDLAWSLTFFRLIFFFKSLRGRGSISNSHHIDKDISVARRGCVV